MTDKAAVWIGRRNLLRGRALYIFDMATVSHLSTNRIGQTMWYGVDGWVQDKTGAWRRQPWNLLYVTMEAVMAELWPENWEESVVSVDLEQRINQRTTLPIVYHVSEIDEDRLAYLKIERSPPSPAPLLSLSPTPPPNPVPPPPPPPVPVVVTPLEEEEERKEKNFPHEYEGYS